MAQSGLKTLRNYFPDDMFAKLSRELDWIRKLEQAWGRRVPAPLALHTCPVSYRSGRLLVQATSSLWASRLRHQRERLIVVLQQDPLFRELVELHVRVAPLAKSADTERKTGASKATTRLSTAAAALIRAMAEDIEDPGLKAALHRLGARAEKGS